MYTYKRYIEKVKERETQNVRSGGGKKNQKHVNIKLIIWFSSKCG